MTDQHYPRALRLLAAADFKQVMDGAVYKASQQNFLLLATPSARPHSRIGFIVAKKKVRLAVDRNRIKRCMRENFRFLQADMPPMDIVFLARNDLAALTNPQLHAACRDSLKRLARKAAKTAS
ncbi:ribonuclease P protein component [Perlucidibaca piscinae]|uniref:ribonuclease P protein component n=1 Tax=Perlucidibaca piscinae TaxID=392589 RepID=UPI0003B358A5|nr:ribonuclease P protein component [Perlucidibaca piscinae]